MRGSEKDRLKRVGRVKKMKEIGRHRKKMDQKRSLQIEEKFSCFIYNKYAKTIPE